jgi:hypothetical protein
MSCLGHLPQALLITVLCSYSGDRTIIHHIPWAQLVISPAEDGSSSQDFGRHIYFGLRFISVDGNPSTEGRYEYGVESRDSAYFRNDGKITNPGSGGSGRCSCETEMCMQLPRAIGIHDVAGIEARVNPDHACDTIACLSDVPLFLPFT